MIDEHDAVRLAAAEAVNRGWRAQVQRVARWSEARDQVNFYRVVDIPDDAWVVFFPGSIELRLGESQIIVLSSDGISVLYAGGAGDEG